jgi:OmpA-OmpF porin, OOP family
MKRITFSTFAILFLTVLKMNAQEIKDYKNFDFVPGEKILLDDNLVNDKVSTSPVNWNIEGGKATVENENNEKYISINEYYTRLSPKIKNLKQLPDTFTIEYDTWLDAGYDGNPGVEILLIKGEQQILITPNKMVLTVSYPNDGYASKDNPEEYFGDNKFYNRWVHISISYFNKHLVVYLDQHKQIIIDDCRLQPAKLLVTGNTSGTMKILLKNFKLATSIPAKVFELKNGKFITHAIKFDVNKSIVKPESMSIINEIAAYLKSNPTTNFEIGGHTDSDGDDAANMKLSEERANAVKTLLVSLAVKDSQLSTKGYGETKPIDNNTSVEGKANNRRVEFVKK